MNSFYEPENLPMYIGVLVYTCIFFIFGLFAYIETTFSSNDGPIRKAIRKSLRRCFIVTEGD